MSPDVGPRIFISYRREETAPYAGRLYDRLSDRFGEQQVFMDVDSIEPGLDFTEAIRSAVGSCDVLLALIGRQWLAMADTGGQRRIDNPSDYVFIEIEAALQRNVRVVPILVDGAEMPRQEELPVALQALSHRQALAISHSQFRAESTYLIGLLERTSDSEMARQHMHSGVATTSASTSKWDLRSADRENYKRRFLVSRHSTHEIEYSLDVSNKRYGIAAPELLKVDGKTETIGGIHGSTTSGSFFLVDGGEAVPAKISIRGSFWGYKIVGCRLEIDGQVLYQE